ncbi:hypothetical protein A2U01_0017395, partial [Trifolium medium]|nr:hypothetical protein [Trifolium medium]
MVPPIPSNSHTPSVAAESNLDHPPFHVNTLPSLYEQLFNHHYLHPLIRSDFSLTKPSAAVLFLSVFLDVALMVVVPSRLESTKPERGLPCHDSQTVRPMTVVMVMRPRILCACSKIPFEEAMTVRPSAPVTPVMSLICRKIAHVHESVSATPPFSPPLQPRFEGLE